MKETHAIDVKRQIRIKWKKPPAVILYDLSDHLLKLERWIACGLA